MRWFALLLVVVPFGLFAREATGVGLAPFQTPDPVNGGQMPGFVFYPSGRPVEATSSIGPYNVAATFDAPALPEAKPLVVISHGKGDPISVPGADHWVFMPPCSPELARDAAEICSDPPGVDRAKVHRQINADALAFFRQTLTTESD